MLTEKEVCERAQYCYLICLQLNWMLSNDSIQPVKYLEQIRKSSLGLAEDDFIVMSLEEGMKSGLEDCGVNNLILMYESFVHAFCDRPYYFVRAATPQVLLDEVDKVI